MKLYLRKWEIFVLNIDITIFSCRSHLRPLACSMFFLIVIQRVFNSWQEKIKFPQFKRLVHQWILFLKGHLEEDSLHTQKKKFYNLTINKDNLFLIFYVLHKRDIKDIHKVNCDPFLDLFPSPKLSFNL